VPHPNLIVGPTNRLVADLELGCAVKFAKVSHDQFSLFSGESRVTLILSPIYSRE